MRSLGALLFASLVLFVASSARAQSAATTARDALDDLDVLACVAEAGWTFESLPMDTLRVAVVVHPDGLWSLASGTFEELATADATRRDLLQHCLERGLEVLLPAPIAGPPRAALVVTRTVRAPSPGESAVDDFVRAQRPRIVACLFDAERPSRRRVAARLHVVRGPDGTPRVSGRGRDAAAIVRCVQPLIGETRVGADVDVEVAFRAPPVADPSTPPPPPHPSGPRPDGREGAVCSWGQYRPDGQQLPEPMPCRAGLTCCGGGAAGSDSFCRRVPDGVCPALP